MSYKSLISFLIKKTDVLKINIIVPYTLIPKLRFETHLISLSRKNMRVYI